MIGRGLAGLWVLLSIIAGTILGATGVALRTTAGRAVVVGTGLRLANRSIDGTITVGQVTGSLTGGLEARDVSIIGKDSLPLARIPSLSVRYRLKDLVGGRIVLGQVRVAEPVITIVQDSSGRFNFQRILRLGGPSRGGRKPLVAFNDVEIEGGDLQIRTPASRGDTAKHGRVPEIENGLKVRRVQKLHARLSYLRLSSPFPGENAIRADIADLRARVTDPQMVIRSATGSAETAGDSVKLDLSALALGSSRATVRGTLSWPNDTLLLDFKADTRDAVLDDLRPMVAAIPRGLGATGSFNVRSLAGDITSIEATRLTLTGRNGGGTVVGRAGMVLGPRKAWSVKPTDVVVENFNLEYVRGFFDTLPIAGRLTGTVKASGPDDHVDIEADIAFRDSLVPAWPVSTIQGTGVLTISPPDGVTFQDFAVSAARIDLRTVRRLLPAVALQGFVTGEGVLNGPWLEMEYDGLLRHADEPFPETVARGVIQVDARADTLGVWAKLHFDSLHMPGLWTSYPQLRLLGSFAGDVTLEGYLDSLGVKADLAGPPGRITGDGSLVLLGPHYAARDLDFAFHSLDVRALYLEPVGTSLNGRLRGEIDTDTLQAPNGRLVVALDSSRVGGTLVDSAAATITTADSVLRVDSLVAWAPHALLTVRGGLGLRTPRPDSLLIAAELDSLAPLEPIISNLLEMVEDTARVPLGGTLAFSGSVTGSLTDFVLNARAVAPRLRWGAFYAAQTAVRTTWSSSVRGRLMLAADVDSLQFGKLRFTSLAANALGRNDSLGWMVRAQNGEDANVMLAGAAILDSGVTRVPLDSARLLLPSTSWFLEKPTVITLQDSSMDVGTLTLRGVDGVGKVELVGSIPLEGHGRLTVTIDSLALKDVFAVLQKETQAVGGRMGGTIDVAGTARAPQIHADLAALSVAYAGFRMPRIEGLLDYAGHRLQGAFVLRNQRAVVMNIEADLPIDLALRGAATDRDLPGPISIRASADSVDLALLEAVSSGVQNASGRLDGDFGIVGTWARPQLSGSLSVRNGALTYPGIGVRHQGIDGHFVMHGDTLGIERLFLRSNTGTLTVSGRVRMTELTRPVFDLRLSTRDFFTMDVRNFVTVTTTGEFALKGPLIGASLSGQGSVPRGTMHFADLLYKRVVNLEDTLFRGIIDTTLIRRQGLGRAFQNRFVDSLVVDSLRLDMGNEVWLRSTEANIQLAGSVTFSKAGQNYRADGLLTTPRGTYQLPLGMQTATKEFEVTAGEIRMLGTPDLNGLVDINARHMVRPRTGDVVTVFVHIGGTLYSPTITLSSDVQPPLPESEVIAYLLFGGPLNAANAGEQGYDALVKSVASSLTGQLENVLLANLGVPISLDYLQFSPATSGTEVQAGWQFTVFGIPAWFTPRTRLCFGEGTDWGASLEVRLSSEFRLAASVDPVRPCTRQGTTQSTVNRQPGVDLLWEKNY